MDKTKGRSKRYNVSQCPLEKQGPYESRYYRNEGFVGSELVDVPATWQNRQTSDRRRRRLIIAWAVAVTCVLIVGAMVGAVIASTLGQDGSDQPKEYVEIEVTKEINSEVTLLGIDFDADYLNQSSKKYQTTAAELDKKYDDQFKNSKLKDMYVGTTVLGFRNGSLIGEVKSKFKKKVKVEKKKPSDTTSATTTLATIELSAEDFGLKAEDVMNVIKDIPGIKPSAVSDIDECSPNPCNNGATCIDQVNNYTCVCRQGYTGDNCETDINECSPNPCNNGATCIDQVNSYICLCKNGFTGSNCDTGPV